MIKSFLSARIWLIGLLPLLLLLVVALEGCTLERALIRPKKNLSPDEPVYYDFIARKYYIRGEYEKAIFQYQKILDKFSDREEYRKELAWAEYEIGFCYYQMGELDKAEEYFDRVINRYNQVSARILAQKIMTKMKGENN